MDKGKNVVQRSRKQNSQQRTFNSSRQALFSQANELAASYDAEVGIIVFSNNGDMFLHCNEPFSLERIVGRYKSRTSSGAPHPQLHVNLQPEGSIHGDLVDLRNGINHIGQCLLHYTSRDNWRQMKMESMDNLERELRSALLEVQIRKDQLLQQELQRLREKEETLAEENNRIYNLIRNYQVGQQQDLLQTMMIPSSSEHQAHDDVLNQFPFAGEEQPSIVLHLATLQPLFDTHQQQNMPMKNEDHPSSLPSHCSDFNTAFDPPRL